MNYKRFSKQICVLLSCVFGSACMSDQNTPTADINMKENGVTNTSLTHKKSNRNDLNLTVFLDLSDRIKDHVPGSTMKDRDIEVMEQITSAFKDHIKMKKLRQMDDHVKVIIEPMPNETSIVSEIKALQFEANKKITLASLENMPNIFRKGLDKIYGFAEEAKSFQGSDIFGFFKSEKVRQYAISEDKDNVLVILTDGYIYHKDNLIKDGSRKSYVTGTSLSSSGVEKINWQNIIKNDNHGLIRLNADLNMNVHYPDLEVVVIGLDAGEKHQNFGADIIKAYWREWLKDMSISKVSFIENDEPSFYETELERLILGL